MKKQMVGLSVAAAVCVLGTTLMGAPAIAAPAGVSQVELEKTKSSLAASDIAPAQQAELLQKVTDGELWDAASGEAAVSSTTKQQGDYKVTKDVYADGSYTEMGIEQGRQASPAELQAMIAQAKPFLDGTVKSHVVLPPPRRVESPLKPRASATVSSVTMEAFATRRAATSTTTVSRGVTVSTRITRSPRRRPSRSSSRIPTRSSPCWPSRMRSRSHETTAATSVTSSTCLPGDGATPRSGSTCGRPPVGHPSPAPKIERKLGRRRTSCSDSHHSTFSGP